MPGGDRRTDTLEAELGVKLFHRTSRKTWLSRAGTRLYPAVVRILDSVEAVRALVQNRDLAEPCRMAMGLAEHAAGEPFTRLLFELEHRRPPMAVDLRELAPTELATLVGDRLLDVAIGLEPIVAAGLTQRRAWAEPLSLLVPLGACNPVGVCSCWGKFGLTRVKVSWWRSWCGG